MDRVPQIDESSDDSFAESESENEEVSDFREKNWSILRDLACFIF
jgi:hypothetical protein